MEGTDMATATRIMVFAWAIAMLCPPVVTAGTVTLQNGLNGYTGTTDAWLDASQARDNYGGAPDLHIRWYNGRDDCVVLKFDLTGQIPQGAAIISATLSLYYVTAGSFQNDNAVTIKPFRLQASAWWDENAGSGLYGEGVSYRYRDINESYEWTGGEEGGWWDKLDDGNGTNKIKDTNGSPPDAIPPGNWVSFDVTPSVIQWRGGATNNGFLLVATGFQGGGTTVYGVFVSRNDSGAGYRPKLAITYEPPVPARESSWGRIKGLYR
jgi:hypothetical protein